MLKKNKNRGSLILQNLSYISILDISKMSKIDFREKFFKKIVTG